MTTDQYTPIYTREQGVPYLAGWRARRDAKHGTTIDPALVRPEVDRGDYYARGWYEADFAIRLGRDIGQLTRRE